MTEQETSKSTRKSKRKPILALDADGVLFNCEKSFKEVGSDILNRPIITLNSYYDLEKRLGFTPEELEATFDAMMHHDRGWRGMDMLEGSQEAFLMLQETYEIHIVTAIPLEVRPLREEGLAFYNLYPKDIHCTGHHLASKKDILEKLSPHVFVDDRLSHLIQASFVPLRIWIDNGDDQDGLLPIKEAFSFPNLISWAMQEKTINKGAEAPLLIV